MVFALSSASPALAVTGGDVLEKMSTEERFAYLSGMIEGLAQARWIADKPDASGSTCIQDWFYKSGDNQWPAIQQWLTRHADKPAGALIYVLIKKECGA